MITYQLMDCGSKKRKTGSRWRGDYDRRTDVRFWYRRFLQKVNRKCFNLMTYFYIKKYFDKECHY